MNTSGLLYVLTFVPLSSWKWACFCISAPHHTMASKNPQKKIIRKIRQLSQSRAEKTRAQCGDSRLQEWMWRMLAIFLFKLFKLFWISVTILNIRMLILVLYEVQGRLDAFWLESKAFCNNLLLDLSFNTFWIKAFLFTKVLTYNLMSAFSIDSLDLVYKIEENEENFHFSTI